MPLDIDDLLTGDVPRLRAVHAFIHEYDFLRFNEDFLKGASHRNLRCLATTLVIQYNDPFLGTTEYSAVVDDDTICDYFSRGQLVERIMKEMKELRENKFIELITTIDYAYKEYGNGATN